MNKQIKAALKKIAPAISFSVSYERDPHFTWDGDGPDPTEDGFDVYDVDVCARTIVDGETVEGCGSMGGTYEEPGKYDPDIHGYLPQMLNEAVSELAEQNKLPAAVKKQVAAAEKYLKVYMRRSYDKQMKGR